ncbi:MFS transporter [Stereum hirsutum FP-91666 SS1]|uniref:MFS transporter n=1 Tax=Stereum hirsutum (strain FP-91666) TaxID=721885 RepID=UPI0004449D23|nr:MFS transporter [Stereum hirsutum FP-91666 SS1]EIM85641.1 MFS transporter [Stereum hirsutum FP-91666 SS1]
MSQKISSTRSGDDTFEGLSVEERKRMTKRVLWKFDCYILPPLALLWLANFIDRTNVGNARIAGLQTDTHLVGNQFNIALAVFYILYILSELPSNWVLKRMGANRWLPFLICIWGTVTTLSGLVQNFAGLTAVRMILGMCEGGLLPGMILYLSTIYRRHELQLRVGIFYASASLSGAFGGLLASAIIRMDGIGGLAGWRWIFILEGIVTVLFGVMAAFVMPASIQSANFLTPEEKRFALHRFRMSERTANSAPLSEPSQRITTTEKEEKDLEEVRAEVYDPNASNDREEPVVHQEEEQFEWREVVRGLVDVQAWLTGIAYFGIIVSIYSYSLFLPTIISELGFSGGEAQLRTVPPYVPAAVLTVVVAYLSDRFKLRGPMILICLPLTIAGYIVAICATSNQVRYAAVFMMATGIYPTGPCILSILPNNSSGHYKKATTIALQLAFANTGGFVATFSYTQDQAPAYIRGHSITLAFVVLAWIFVALNVTYCAWENKARADGRRQDNILKYQELWDSGKTRAPIGDRHPDFRFTL